MHVDEYVNNDTNMGLSGNIAQKLETVKSEETLWNEYFTNILYYSLSNHPVINTETRQKITKSSAEWADLMIDEYLDRYGSDE